MVYYVKADGFLLEKECKEDGYLSVQDGVFGGFVEKVPNGARVIDWSGCTIAPGLFDTHIHGIRGYDVMDGTTSAIQEISKALVEVGVTRFLPTTLTSSDHDLEQAILAIKEVTTNGLEGAQSEGIFLEGPYFTERHKGAQNPSYFKDPSVEEFRKLQTLADGQIVKLALAPERTGAIEFIRALSDEILISLAHSDASYTECVNANQAGARNYVHLYNGMSGLHHREPGVVGAALLDEKCFAELICDGHHVHPDVAKLTLKIKEGNLLLISDCMRAGLMPDGHYQLGEFPVVMEDGIARTEGGSLAGSTLTLLEGALNLQKWSKRPLHEIWHLASLTPAKSLGVDDRLGSITKGKLADYVVLDQQQKIIATAIEGVIKYKKED